jgi:hypothetical protein
MAATNGQNGSNGAKVAVGARWAGIAVTVLLAAGAITIQWGVVTAKLRQVEKRLDELIVEARALRTEYQSIERRVSYLEGRLNGRPGQ